MWCGPDYCSNLWHSSTGTLVGSRVAQWPLAVSVANLCTVQAYTIRVFYESQAAGC